MCTHPPMYLHHRDISSPLFPLPSAGGASTQGGLQIKKQSLRMSVNHFIYVQLIFWTRQQHYSSAVHCRSDLTHSLVSVTKCRHEKCKLVFDLNKQTRGKGAYLLPGWRKKNLLARILIVESQLFACIKNKNQRTLVSSHWDFLK